MVVKSSLAERVRTALLDSVEHQDSELVVLEGPAAASAVRTLRDRQTQALLPMQGKVPNATRVSWRKLSQHSQIADLLQSLHPQRSAQYNAEDAGFAEDQLFDCVCLLYTSDAADE